MELEASKNESAFPSIDEFDMPVLSGLSIYQYTLIKIAAALAPRFFEQPELLPDYAERITEHIVESL